MEQSTVETPTDETGSREEPSVPGPWPLAPGPSAGDVPPPSTDNGIVRAAAEYGYELHAVDLAGGTARATATQAPDLRLKNLVMEMRGQNWVILSH